MGFAGGKKVFGNAGGFVATGAKQGGAAAAWTPQALTQLVARYLASSIGLSDLAAVSSWPDIKGTTNATQATGSKQPLYRTGSGSPFVQFDGVDDYLTLTATLASVTGDFAVYSVFQYHNITGVGKRLLDMDFTNGFWIGADTSGLGTLGGGIRQSGSPFGDFYTAANNTFYAMIFQRIGTTKTIRFAGTPHTATVVATALTPVAIRIGEDVAADGSCGQVDVKEIAICNTGFSAGDITNLVAYSLSAYGLTL